MCSSALQAFPYGLADDPTHGKDAMMAHVWKSRFGHKPDPDKCAAAVSDGGSWPRWHQCRRKGVNTEAGHVWCRQHTPSLVKARDDERNGQWKREWDERDRMRKVASMKDAIAQVAIDLFDQNATYEDLERAVMAFLALITTE